MIGLDLDDATARTGEQHRRADQIGGDLVHASAEKGSAQALPHVPIVAGSAAVGKSTVK
jgi:hypothetical protein